jgi:hypothetical protein
MQAQAQANGQAQQAAAQAEMQKKQAAIQADIQLEQAKADLKTKFLDAEVKAKKDLMDHEYDINVKVRQLEDQSVPATDVMKENKKDDREDKKIRERKQARQPKNFESSGNDIIGQGIGLGDM